MNGSLRYPFLKFPIEIVYILNQEVYSLTIEKP